MLAKCPNCGAEFEPSTDNIFLVCKFCSASIYIFQGRGGISYVSKPQVPIENTELIIRDFFTKNEYTGKIKIDKKEAILFPFYKIDDSGKLIPATFNQHNASLSNFVCRGGELSFFKDDENYKYRLLEPDLEPDNSQTKSINIVYYPLIFVDYEYSDERYSLIIDGLSQDVIAEILPLKRNTFIEKVYMYLFIITSFLLFIEIYSFDSVAIGLGLNIITLIIIWFVFPLLFNLIEDIYVSEDKDNKMP